MIAAIDARKPTEQSGVADESGYHVATDHREWARRDQAPHGPDAELRCNARRHLRGR